MRSGAGSSPHTRGLRRRPLLRRDPVRIIPAHAGFTARPRPGRPRGPDHPRTRGVYQGVSLTRGCVVGSSPHTRGLRHGAPERGDTGGIIPAHAGFTWVASIDKAVERDHPRTRGVYVSISALIVFTAGSSPHTRGLRFADSAPATHSGIIPAHAGFTCQYYSCCCQCSDHPRTRGVYGVCGGDSRVPAGSSPHTRGLPRAGSAPSPNCRIIPAHAGFTIWGLPKTPRAGDHPRTRGVYFSSMMMTTVVLDHPRTRGVYRGTCTGVRG